MAKALRKEDRITGPLKQKDQVIYNTHEMVEIFANTFENQFKPNPSTDQRLENQIQQELEEIISQSEETPTEELVTYEEVKNSIKFLNKKKAPGPDNVNNQAIKKSPIQLYTNSNCNNKCHLKTPILPRNVEKKQHSRNKKTKQKQI